MEGSENELVKNVTEDFAEDGQNSSLQFLCNGQQNLTLIGSNLNYQIVEVRLGFCSNQFPSTQTLACGQF